MKQDSFLTSDTLDFIQNNVYNVSDLTRKNKLSEILQKFVSSTDEAFVIENAKSKDAKGVLIDLKYFEQLLKYKEAIDQVIDEEIEKEAIKRIETDQVNEVIPIEKAFSDDDFDLEILDKEFNHEN